MAKQQESRTNESISTTLGKETVFRGTMKFSKSLKIDGTFEGEIDSSGFLYVDENAVVTADIKVRSMIIGGTVRGNIVATEKLEMLSTGRVYGDIQTPRLRIADGVVFEGKCEMIKNPDDVDIFSAPPDKIKSLISPS
jgi:cytoskeletal protein CcmA (bactofilin family)